MLLLVLCAGFFDRIRGDQFDLFSRTVEKLVYGWIIATLAGHGQDAYTIPFAILFAFGISPGWGNPIGAALNRLSPDVHRNFLLMQHAPAEFETWQIGILRKNTYLALVVRGIITGIPIILTGLWIESIIVMTAYAIAFPLACRIANIFNNPGDWGHQEYFRGWIAGLTIWGLS